MDPEVQAVIDAIDPKNRPLFDRFARLVVDERPDAELRLSYKMPTYVVGPNRLHVGVWKHGLSFYGLDAAFVERRPELKAHKSTIQLTRAAAEHIGDDELRQLIREALPTPGDS